MSQSQSQSQSQGGGSSGRVDGTRCRSVALVAYVTVCRDGRPDDPPQRDVELTLRERADRRWRSGNVLVSVVGLDVRWALLDLIGIEGDGPSVTSCDRRQVGEFSFGNLPAVAAEALRMIDQKATEAIEAIDWEDRVHWLWRQDDACAQEDTVIRAWIRLWGDAKMPDDWVSRIDGGDAETLLSADGRVYCASYPGENRIGVLRGSLAWTRLSLVGNPSSPPVGSGLLRSPAIVAQVVAARRDAEDPANDESPGIDEARRRLRRLHWAVLGVDVDLTGPSPSLAAEYPAGHARQGALLPMSRTDPADSVHPTAELDRMERAHG